MVIQKIINMQTWKVHTHGEVCSHHVGLYKADFIMQLERRKSMEC